MEAFARKTCSRREPGTVSEAGPREKPSRDGRCIAADGINEPPRAVVPTKARGFQPAPVFFIHTTNSKTQQDERRFKW